MPEQLTPPLSLLSYMVSSYLCQVLWTGSRLGLYEVIQDPLTERAFGSKNGAEAAFTEPQTKSSCGNRAQTLTSVFHSTEHC